MPANTHAPATLASPESTMLAAKWPSHMDNPLAMADTDAITAFAARDVFVPAIPYAMPTPRLSRLDATLKTMTVNRVDRAVEKPPLFGPHAWSYEYPTGVAYVNWEQWVTGMGESRFIGWLSSFWIK